jgi:hypothetical protein
MSDGETRSSFLRRRPVHATSGVLDETGQERAVVEAEQAGPVTNGYAWSGRMRATGDVVETMIPRRLDRLPWSRWHRTVTTSDTVTLPTTTVVSTSIELTTATLTAPPVTSGPG